MVKKKSKMTKNHNFLASLCTITSKIVNTEFIISKYFSMQVYKYKIKYKNYAKVKQNTIHVFFLIRFMKLNSNIKNIQTMQIYMEKKSHKKFINCKYVVLTCVCIHCPHGN